MNTSNPRFLCAGLIMHDILIQGVSSLPQHWEDMVTGQSAYSDTGGGAANSARTLGRLGADVEIIGRIGNDGFAGLIRDSFRRDHVSTDHLIVDWEKPSGIAAALVADDGQRCFATVQGCNRSLCLDDFSGIDFADYDFVHINGYFQFPSLEKDMAALLLRARSEGCIISFDTASWDPSGKWYETIRPFSGCIDYFFANEAQILKLTGRPDIGSAAQYLLRDGVRHVIVKRGGEGSILYEGSGDTCESEAFSGPILDTTGAGDSFDAAYMLGVSKGWSPAVCGRFANTVAGLNCRELGATSGVPDYQKAVCAMETLTTYKNPKNMEETLCHL